MIVGLPRLAVRVRGSSDGQQVPCRGGGREQRARRSLARGRGGRDGGDGRRSWDISGNYMQHSPILSPSERLGMCGWVPGLPKGSMTEDRCPPSEPADPSWTSEARMSCRSTSTESDSAGSQSFGRTFLMIPGMRCVRSPLNIPSCGGRGGHRGRAALPRRRR